MRNILIIEDEEKVLEVLKAYLEKEGYSVYGTASGLDGIDIFTKMDIELVILDLMLPDIDGEEVCRSIRKMSDVFIFMLTAKGALSDRIEGLNIGADEYLVKPFSPRELVARVNAVFRRLDKDKTSSLFFDEGRFEINLDEHYIRIDGREVQLTPNEFDILYALVSARGKVMTREQLIERVFGFDFEGYDRTIDVHIKNIRKKIEKDSRNPKYVITVTRVGYRFGGDN